MPRRKFTKLDSDSDHEELLSKPDVKGKRKKRKITSLNNGAQSKSRALLQPMVDMPIDILLEVFKHLELVDVWHLSQTSKPLRSILRSRTSISVWKQAIANDGLPQCTEDLSEPRLAGLLFGRSCDWCGRNVSGQEIIWAARVRACKRCIELAYKQTDRYNGFSGKYPIVLAQLVPSVVIRNKIFIDKDLDRQFCEEYRLSQSRDGELKWLEARVAERQVIHDHAEACHKWFQSRIENKVMLRKGIIIERLKEMGWEEELNKLTSGTRPTDLTEVVKACQSELSEPILAGLDDILIKFMEKTKTNRLHREREEFFRHKLRRLREIRKEYSLTLPPNQVFPNTADIYSHPTIKKALSAAVSHEVLEEALTRIQLSLPEIVDDCLELSKQALTSLVIDEYNGNNKAFNPSVLELAATLFRCRNCICDLTLDQALAHKCRYYYGYDSTTKAVRDAIDEVTTLYRIRTAITFSLASLESFVSVLHACGIDPNMTSVADMNAIDPVMECLDCSDTERGRVTMRWLSVPKHLQSVTHPIGMSILDEPEAEFVRGRMLEQYQKDTAKTKDHVCAHCRDSGGSMTLMQHVKRDHHVDSPVYGQDVVVSFRVPANRQEFSLWPPKL